MSSVSPSPIDRRILVTRGPDDIRRKAQRVSDLRALPFVVLLGEPGIGKSTVLEQEAGVEGTSVLKVRELINGMRSTADTTLFLDALDEYRIDGQPSDKVHGLAGAMASVGASRWRLSCRSEDWRKDADIRPIQHTTAGAPIVVAQLLPLDQTEALAVLSSLGERDPNDFLARAEAFGAGGFTESPLSLRLLHTAVAAGTWPKTRFDLFASAVESLLYERNEEHKWTERYSREAIVAAASEASLLLLASGAGAIWRSNDEPPADADARAYLTFEDISMERPLLRDTLDTALFRGEGEVFEPMHRTIAEYLAGRCLAQALSGSGDRAALPLSRALSLITGNDGEPPTELRGLYSWFAAHLAKLGHEAEAMRLIETDAVTVLAYGDAAVFGTPARRAILENLDRADPYFRASNVGITAVGGLSGEDLAADFTDVLNDPSDNTHRLATVLEVLTHGEAVHSLRSVLFDIATDPDRPEWQRRRAADAWTNGATDPEHDRRRLFDALADEPVSTAREAVRAHLAAALPSGALTLADVKSVIADFERSPDDNTIMRLSRFTRKLEAEPRPELFDEPTTAWRPAQNERRRTREVDDVLDHALAAAIGGTPNLDGARLWRWIVNVRGNDWTISDGESGKAFATWLNQNPKRETELFDAILADDDPAHGPWMVGNTYIITSGRRPSTALVRGLLSRADAAGTETGSKRLLAIAVEIARHFETDIDLYWKTHEHVAAHPGCDELLEHLSRNALEPRRVGRRRSATEQERRHAAAKAKNLRILAPLANELRVGSHLHHLGRAAEVYFHPVGNEEMQPTGFDRMTDLTDDATARAIAEGWEHLARTGLPNVDAAALGVAEAEMRTDDGERAVVAGLDRLLAEGRCPDLATMPVAVAIVILKSGWSTFNDERQRMLREWAVNRLDLDPAVGAAQILDFWGASLDAGATELGTVWPFMEEDARDGAFQRALEGILASRRAMPPDALRTTLRAAAKHLDQIRLRALADAALAAPSVAGLQRKIWSFVAFVLDPANELGRFLAEHGGGDADRLFDEELGEYLVEAFHGADDHAHAHRDTAIVRLLGPLSSPETTPSTRRTMRSWESSDTVQRAVKALTQNAHRDAGRVLAELIAEPDLAEWRQSLRHAQAQQARLRRDNAFRHPKAATVRGALAGGPPVNASDLRAVVVEELHRLRRELRTNDTTSWKRYWNVDSQGKVTKPLIENECRDNLLDRLRDRLRPYKIAAAAPEVRRSHETRADAVFLTYAGRNLPLEAKRHFHPDIWVAASTQLQGYAADEAADGFGVYLVFWFGNDASPTPARPDGGDGPNSAGELEAMLVADLPPELRSRTDVIILDVSNPDAVSGAKPRKRRTSTAAKPASEKRKGRSRRPAPNA